jgi:hypothetical protein
MATTTVCPVAWIQIGSAQADAAARALIIQAGSGVTLTTTTTAGVATTTIAASGGGGGGGTPATTVVSATSYGQSPAVGVGTDYARADHSHGSPALGTSASTACAGNDSRLADSRAPTGAASGDLAGTYPAPTVTQARGLRETTGPTTLTMGAVADGQYLRRVGSAVVGVYLALYLLNPGPYNAFVTTAKASAFAGSTWA